MLEQPLRELKIDEKHWVEIFLINAGAMMARNLHCF